MITDLPEKLQPWSRVTEEKGKPGATWAVGVLQPRRLVLASGVAGSWTSAQEALSQACARLCEALPPELLEWLQGEAG